MLVIIRAYLLSNTSLVHRKSLILIPIPYYLHAAGVVLCESKPQELPWLHTPWQDPWHSQKVASKCWQLLWLYVLQDTKIVSSLLCISFKFLYPYVTMQFREKTFRAVMAVIAAKINISEYFCLLQTQT